MSNFVINRATDLLPKYMLMGNWKARLLKKGQRASRTSSKKSRLFIAKPPVFGWMGGTPETNGYRGGRKS